MLKIGVCRRLGTLVSNHARKFMAMDNARLAGIYDAKASRAKEIAKTLGAYRF
jgi:predicted dehydrogenase